MLHKGAGHSSGVCAAAATGMSEVLPALRRGVAKLATDMLDYVVYYTHRRPRTLRCTASKDNLYYYATCVKIAFRTSNEKRVLIVFEINPFVQHEITVSVLCF